MKAYLLYLSAGMAGTDQYEVVVAENERAAESYANELASDHAESYGVYAGNEYEWENEEGEESDYSPESHVVKELITEADLEDANDYRTGGGSFREELARDGFTPAA
jgi:hypothetical protein